MDTTKAAAIAQAALASGARHRVFDWDKAARLIVERKPTTAGAGLESDWEWTGGVIYSDGKPVLDSYTYLSSNWAAPQLDLDGELVECWAYQDETTWDSETKWPESALAILNANGAAQ